MIFQRLIAFSLTLGVSSLSFSDSGNIDSIKNDVRIMAQIINTSINNSSMERNRILTKVNSTYLANQGIVFTVKIKKPFGIMPIELPVMPEIPQLPRVPPVSTSPIDILEIDGINTPVIPAEALEELQQIPEQIQESMMQSMELNLEEQRYNQEAVMEQLLESREIRREQQEGLRELRRELREEQRDLREDMRELQREIRSAEDDQTRRELSRELEKMSQVMESLNEKYRQATERFQQKITEYKKRREQKQAEEKQTWSEYIGRIELSLIDTLCNYGGSLKSLPDGQYVSVILENADRSEYKAKDRVHVFSKSDLVSCQRDIISANELKQRGNFYAY